MDAPVALVLLKSTGALFVGPSCVCTRQYRSHGRVGLQALNQTFQDAYASMEVDLPTVIATNLGIFRQFNQTFA